MDDILLAWRNIWRNPRRSILTILAILFASGLLVFMLSFQFGAYEEMIDASVRLSTGHLQIQATCYNEHPTIRKVIREPSRLADLANSLVGVQATGIRTETFGLVAGPDRSRGMAIFGVDPEAEPKISTLHTMIRKGRYLEKTDSGTAIIGELAARRLKISIGDECTILGQTRDGSVGAGLVRIVGIFSTGIDSFDRSGIQLPLTTFDEIFGMNGTGHRIILITDHLGGVERLAESLRQLPELDSLAVLSWDQLNPGLKQGIELDLVSGAIMYTILVLVVAFSILNTFFMAFFERTREFGVLMAIGTRPGRLMKLMLLESFGLSLIGVLFGILLGILTTLYFSAHGISLGEGAELMAQYGLSSRLHPKLSLWSVCLGPGLLCLVTFCTAMIPALKIPRLKPVHALRSL